LLTNSKETKNVIKENIKLYEYEEVISKNQWKPLETRGLNFRKDYDESSNTKFSPKYRIVFFVDKL